MRQEDIMTFDTADMIFKKLWDTSPASAIVYDRNGIKEYVNKITADIFGIEDINAHLKLNTSISDNTGLGMDIRNKI